MFYMGLVRAEPFGVFVGWVHTAWFSLTRLKKKWEWVGPMQEVSGSSDHLR